MFFSNWCPYRIVFLSSSIRFFLWLFIIDWLEIIDGTSWRWQWHSIILCFFLSFSVPSLFCSHTENSKNPKFFLYFAIDAVNMDFLLIPKYLSSYCFGERWLTLEVHYGNIMTGWWNSFSNFHFLSTVTHIIILNFNDWKIIWITVEKISSVV